jgi:hypothetical protein
VNGDIDGTFDGTFDGAGDGNVDDTVDGVTDGTANADGTDDETADGTDDETADGTDDETADGIDDGTTDGAKDGTADGSIEGNVDGKDDGNVDGNVDGVVETFKDGAVDGVMVTDGRSDGFSEACSMPAVAADGWRVGLFISVDGSSLGKDDGEKDTSPVSVKGSSTAVISLLTLLRSSEPVTVTPTLTATTIAMTRAPSRPIHKYRFLDAPPPFCCCGSNETIASSLMLIMLGRRDPPFPLLYNIMRSCLLSRCFRMQSIPSGRLL